MATLQALFCQVTPRHVLNMCDVSNIWHVPIMMEQQGAHKSICDILQLGGHESMDLTGAAQNVAHFQVQKPQAHSSAEIQQASGEEALSVRSEHMPMSGLPLTMMACLVGLMIYEEGSARLAVLSVSRVHAVWLYCCDLIADVACRVAHQAGREVGLPECCCEDSHGGQVHGPL